MLKDRACVVVLLIKPLLVQDDGLSFAIAL